MKIKWVRVKKRCINESRSFIKGTKNRNDLIDLIMKGVTKKRVVFLMRVNTEQIFKKMLREVTEKFKKKMPLVMIN